MERHSAGAILLAHGWLATQPPGFRRDLLGRDPPARTRRYPSNRPITRAV